MTVLFLKAEVQIEQLYKFLFNKVLAMRKY